MCMSSGFCVCLCVCVCLRDCVSVCVYECVKKGLSIKKNKKKHITSCKFIETVRIQNQVLLICVLCFQQNNHVLRNEPVIEALLLGFFFFKWDVLPTSFYYRYNSERLLHHKIISGITFCKNMRNWKGVFFLISFKEKTLFWGRVSVFNARQ